MIITERSVITISAPPSDHLQTKFSKLISTTRIVIHQMYQTVIPLSAIPPKVHIRLIFSKIIQRPETSISNYSYISSLISISNILRCDPISVDLLPRSRGHRVNFQSITTAQDLISGIIRVSIKMRLMTAAWLKCWTLFRVLHKTVRVPDRAAVIAHGQESFYLFCSVTRVTKVSELFFPAKTSAIKNL